MMRKISTVSRYVLGLIFLLSGTVGLLNLVPPPTDMPAGLMEFFKGMMAAKYFFPLLKLTELVAGLLLIAGFAPALALIILAPIVVNIFFVHAFLTPGLSNLLVPLLLVLLLGLSAMNYWNIYRPLFGKNKVS